MQANAGILYLKPNTHIIARLRAGYDAHDDVPRVAKFDSIGDEVVQNLLQFQYVSNQSPWQCCINVYKQF